MPFWLAHMEIYGIDFLTPSLVAYISKYHHHQGVQKELLSLLEGCTVPTKYGPISTTHILFIASGAFHKCLVTDLLPELQGRLPVRVELKPLLYIDLRKILVEKQYNLVDEAIGLLGTEGVTLVLTECAIDEIARYAFNLNNSKGSIGARRLTSVMQVCIIFLDLLCPFSHAFSRTSLCVLCMQIERFVVVLLN
jgi:ATP-dependent protease HslVU (ClpYQ) ATPase subunit